MNHLIYDSLFVSLKELQSSLLARSNEVNDVALAVQVFISERAQDLAPEQSRQLLGRLQQLQRAFHQASGQAQACTESLSTQRDREEEWQRRERAKEEEVWKKLIERDWFGMGLTFIYYIPIYLSFTCRAVHYCNTFQHSYSLEIEQG